MLESLVPKLMEIKGWNKTELMRQSGLSWQHTCDMANGIIPGAKAVDMLCEAADCQPNDIYVHIKKRDL